MTDLLSKSLSEPRQHAFRKPHINQADYEEKNVWPIALQHGCEPKTWLHFHTTATKKRFEKHKSTKLWLWR